ncbi:killer suppression protein [Mycobacterium marseillense]|uniref:killer suppression protein n=1 Tax=Mycobacterium marseillense TaxID=701042 RepID=UPI00119FD0B1|nr:killer suppression protein [Mycobacterium marseillense]
MIIVSFSTPELRELCEDPKLAEAKLGDGVARLLRARLADLRSADGLFDLPTGNPRVDGDNYLLDLGTSATMRWEPYGKSAHPAKNGVLDWECVNRVKLVGIDRGTR